MIKKISALVVILILCLSAVATAEEQGKKEGGFADWLKSIQRKISQIVPKKTVNMSTGVAGVRGAKEDSVARLYWKGKKGAAPVSEEELKEFKEGLDRAESGDKAGAIHEFEEFMKLYPDSALIPDVKKTLDLITIAKGEEEKAKQDAGPGAEKKADPPLEQKAEQGAELKPQPAAEQNAAPQAK